MTGAHTQGESDWEDLDLLTVGLAHERLDQEIAALEASLAEPARPSGPGRPSPDGADRTAAQARLDALRMARERMRNRPPAR